MKADSDETRRARAAAGDATGGDAVTSPAAAPPADRGSHTPRQKPGGCTTREAGRGCGAGTTHGWGHQTGVWGGMCACDVLAQQRGARPRARGGRAAGRHFAPGRTRRGARRRAAFCWAKVREHCSLVGSGVHISSARWAARRRARARRAGRRPPGGTRARAGAGQGRAYEMPAVAGGGRRAGLGLVGAARGGRGAGGEPSDQRSAAGKPGPAAARGVGTGIRRPSQEAR